MKVLDETSRAMPELGAALDRHLLDVNGVMKEPVSGEALNLGKAISRNLIIDVLVSREGVDRATRVSETFQLRVDSVQDTVSDRWLTLDSAVDSGIIIPSHGEYVDRRRGIHIPLIDAVRDGLIQGRLLDVERKKEEVTRTDKEAAEGLPLSLNIQAVVDPRTGLELSMQDAVDAGIFDATTGEFIDLKTGERLPLERAVAVGLVLADSVVQQTYSIGAVRDPATGELIPPSEAEARGLLDMARGIYIIPRTEEAITLAEALERGLIRAEPLEDGVEIPMKITRVSKFERGRMVFNIKSVKDLSTGEMVSPEEAVSRGILDTVKGVYIDSRTGETMLLHEAYEAGLIEAVTIETSSQPDDQSERQPVNIVAVVDPRSDEELTVAEAIDRHLLDAALTQFMNLSTSEVMSIDEAVIRGYVITTDYDTSRPGPAAVLHDTQSYRIKSVIDPRTGEEIPIADAVRHKIVDKANNMYWNMRTDEVIPIDEAVRLGLVITEPVDAAVTKTAQWETGDDFSKQVYLLTAVKDPRTGKEYDLVEAERRGLFNKLQGVYINPVTGEKIPVDEAIARNLINYSVVAEGDYDELPADAYTTVATSRPVRQAENAGVWDPVSGCQVLAVCVC